MQAPTRWIRDDATRGERALGITWLCLGAIMSALLEVVYLGAWLPFLHVPFPITIVIAYLFNGVLTRTARLWSAATLVVAAPFLAWLGGFLGLMVFGAVGGHTLLMASPLSLFLLLAGCAGYVVTAWRLKVAQ